jgi:hypothetical protein
MSTLLTHLQAFLGSKGCLLMLALLAMGSVIVYAENDTTGPLPAEMRQSAYLMDVAAGVQAYRDGNYLLAHKWFDPLHAQHPENSKITYYLAITEAQLGRFPQAKKLYEEILTLDPNGDAAKLAAEGLKFLPTDAGLDLPPRFQGGATQQAATAQSNATVPTTGTVPGQSAAGPTMSPQDWMAMQMMMGQSGMNGMNAMPWMMMPGAAGANTNGASGMGGFDPSLMSTMMMNQMMQNMNMSGNSDENR